jgi:hypothetical protein
LTGIIELDHILIGADLDVAGGNDLGLVGEGVLHVGGRNLMRLHGARIEVHLHGAEFAAIGSWNGRARH